jgi:hypothetical protein
MFGESSLRVVGELTRDATVGDLSSTVGISTATRVEEKLKRMREERRAAREGLSVFIEQECYESCRFGPSVRLSTS